MKHQHQPEDYRHIWAWGRMLDSAPSYIRAEQERASKAGAPLDAIFERSTGTWATYDGIADGDTRTTIDRIIETRLKV